MCIYRFIITIYNVKQSIAIMEPFVHLGVLGDGNQAGRYLQGVSPSFGIHLQTKMLSSHNVSYSRGVPAALWVLLMCTRPHIFSFVTKQWACS